MKYFEALDLLIVLIKTRFDQPSFKSLLNLESFLLQSIEGQEVDEEIIKYLSETYGDDLDVGALHAETPVLRTILSEVDVSMTFTNIWMKPRQIKNSYLML